MARKRADPPDYGSRFKAGTSGNPGGRPKGSRNHKRIIEKELSGKVTVTENGRRQRLSKGEVAIRQLVNRAAAGDAKALQTVWNYHRTAEAQDTKARDPLEVFDTPKHHLVMDSICRRIRAMEELPAEPQAAPDLPPEM